MILSPIRAVFAILLLWLAGLGAAAQFAKIALPFAQVQAAWPDAGVAIGWLLSIISLTGLLFGLSGGLLMARIGLRAPLIAAMALGAALSWRQAALPPLSEMLALRVAEGLSHVVIVIAAPTLIGLIAPPRWRGLAMTLWSTFFGVAFALMALIGLPFTESHGLAALMRAHGVWMALIGLLLMPALADVRPELNTATASRQGLIARHIAAYRSPRIAAPGWGWLFYTLTFVAALALLPPLLPADQRALLVSGMPLVGLAVSLICVPPLLRFAAATSVVAAGFALAAALALLGVAGLKLAWLCLPVFAVLGLVQGGSFAAVPQLNATAKDQALANGAMAQMGNLGNMIGTPLLLAALHQTGQRGLWMLLAALYLGGAATHLLLARRRRLG